MWVLKVNRWRRETVTLIKIIEKYRIVKSIWTRWPSNEK
jgi:hypothetical protein